MRFAEALAELNGRQPERMVPDLSRIAAMAELLDDPQLTYPTIHITGTNGKTTTSRLITSLACTHGLRVGTYTSPHLESVTERISICSDPISEEDFGEEYGHLLPYLLTVDGRSEEQVTYFETLTALAYLWFADKPVSVGVFEVGMGGRWDATNLVAGDVAVLCPIALDHPELGSTVEEVASEKADIIKPGKVAIVREQPEEAMRVIEGKAAAVGANLLLEGRDFEVADCKQAIGGQAIKIRGMRDTYEELFVPMFGDHAARNAAAAVAATEAFLDRPLSVKAVRAGLRDARSPGRLEVVARRPLVILDGAHNPAGAQALASALPEAFTWKRLILVAAMSANKSLEGIVSAIAPLADDVIATRNSSERSAEATTAAEAFRAAGVEAAVSPDVASAIAGALHSAGEEDAVVITGSLYTVADARRALES